MKKLLLSVSLLGITLLSLTGKVQAAENFTFEQNFTWNEEDHEVGTPSGSNKWNVYSVSPSGTENTPTLSILNEEDGILRFYTKAKAEEDAETQIRFQKNGGAKNLFDDDGKSIVIKSRFRFDKTYRKGVKIFFAGGEINTASKTYKVLEMTGTEFAYNWSGGSDQKITNKTTPATNVWHDLIVVLKDNEGSNDHVYTYLDQELIYDTDLNSDDELKGLSNLMFYNSKSGNTPEFNWDFDYVKVGEYNGATATKPADQTVKEGEDFEMKPQLTGTNPDYDASVSDYQVSIPVDSQSKLSYSEGKFHALQKTDTPITVTFDFIDPLIADVTAQVTIEQATTVTNIQSASVVREDRIQLVKGETFSLDSVFKAIPQEASNTTLEYESDQPAFTVAGNTLTAVSAGTGTLTVKSQANPSVKKEITVTVLDGVFGNLNQFEAKEAADDTSSDSDKKTLSYGGKTFVPTSVDTDTIYGNVLKFTGQANGGSHYDCWLSSDLQENKDYKLTGWVKMAGSGSGTAEIKLMPYYFGDNSAKGYVSQQAPYYSALKLTASQSGSDWYYFETAAVNFDKSGFADLEFVSVGLKTEIGVYNTSATQTISFAHLALSEQTSVQNSTGFRVQIDGNTYSSDTITLTGHAKGSQITVSALPIPSTSALNLSLEEENPSGLITIEGTTITLNDSGVATVKIIGGGVVKTLSIEISNPATSVSAEQNVSIDLSSKNNSYSLTVEPAGATSVFNVRVEDDTICTAEIVEGKLYIVPKAAGTTKVTVYSQDDENVKAEINVTVTEPVKEPTITVKEENVVMEKDGSYVIEASTDFGSIEYSSSDTSIATVSANGEVTAVGVGTCTITIKVGNVTKTIQITVGVKATGLTIPDSTVSLKKNQEYRIRATATPDNTTQTISYESSDTKVVTVDSSGKVVAVGAGTAKVTIRIGDITKVISFTVTESSNQMLYIILGVIGGVVVLAAASFGVVWFVKKRKK